MRRLVLDQEEMLKSPVANVSAAPLDSDMFEWHCNIQQDDVIYHLILFMPHNYPFESPSAEFLPKGFAFSGGATMDGKKGTKVCLNIFSDFAMYHTEWKNQKGFGWSPGYSTQTVLMNLVAFLAETAGDYQKDANRKLSKNFKSLTTPCEFLSGESFFNMQTSVGVVHSTLKEELKFFLPMYIHPTHGAAIKKTFENTIEAVGKILPSVRKSTSFEEIVVKTIPNLMAATVVEFSKGTQHTSDNSLNGYFALHRLLLWALDTYPKLQPLVETRLKVLFLDIALPSSMSRADVVKRYDDHFGFPTPEMVAEMKVACDRIKNQMKTYDDWFKVLKLKPLTEDQLFQKLVDAVKFSIVTNGYHWSFFRDQGGWKDVLNKYKDLKKQGGTKGKGKGPAKGGDTAKGKKSAKDKEEDKKDDEMAAEEEEPKGRGRGRGRGRGARGGARGGAAKRRPKEEEESEEEESEWEESEEEEVKPRGRGAGRGGARGAKRGAAASKSPGPQRKRGRRS
nr:hypothetical protein BaRGS_008355 [Batillaria attramentaria]